VICPLSGGLPYAPGMSERVGYARCGLDKRELTAQCGILLGLDVPETRIYLGHGPTGTNRDRSGFAQAVAAVCAGDTLVFPKLDRLTRSVPDAGATVYRVLERAGQRAGHGKPDGSA
jgi:DNA invertase Pin-like site-specific DNA recombinase